MVEGIKGPDSTQGGQPIKPPEQGPQKSLFSLACEKFASIFGGKGSSSIPNQELSGTAKVTSDKVGNIKSVEEIESSAKALAKDCIPVARAIRETFSSDLSSEEKRTAVANLISSAQKNIGDDGTDLIKNMSFKRFCTSENFSKEDLQLLIPKTESHRLKFSSDVTKLQLTEQAKAVLTENNIPF